MSSGWLAFWIGIGGMALVLAVEWLLLKMGVKPDDNED